VCVGGWVCGCVCVCVWVGGCACACVCVCLKPDLSSQSLMSQNRVINVPCTVHALTLAHILMGVVCV